MTKPLIWLTRPRADSEAMAKILAKEHIGSIVAPVLSVETLHAALPAKPDGIVVTSRHALPIIAAETSWHALPLFAVGRITAEAARAQGFHNVIEGGGNVLKLAELIAARKAGKTLLYPCGEETRYDLPALLQGRGVTVRPLVAYRTVAATELPKEFIDAAQRGAVTCAALFSKRSAYTARALLEAASLTPREMDACCLSLDVANAAGAGWRAVHVAERPDGGAMIKLIVSSSGL